MKGELTMVRRGLVLWLSFAFASLAASLAPSQARHARHVRIVSDAIVCTPVARVTPEILPAPNWEPFFRHHYYSYGPTPKCIPDAVSSVAVTEPVLSVRY
jgi:hypothetical protein